MSDDELPPSQLGTKDHWDSVYEQEVRVFKDVGDEGEVWFGESSVSKMRQWASANLPESPISSSTPLRILECGSGNGTLLLSFLTSTSSSSSPEPPRPQKYHLTGIDYSDLATTLASSIEKTRRQSLEEDIDEDEEVINECEVEWRTADLLRQDFKGETWDLVLDKGTFDALALSADGVAEEGGRLPSQVYPERISKLVKPGGWFLITSCNFTEGEIKKRYTKEGLGFKFHSSVPHKSFSFGGKSGTTVCTVAFQKQELLASIQATRSTAPPLNAAASSSTSNGHNPRGAPAQDRSVNGTTGLYMCIDCGGTKTDVAIASGSGKIISRAEGGTSNMAEVGLETCYAIIIDTVLKAVATLPDEIPRLPNIENENICPVTFEDIWIGISGCDTELDEQTMSDLLGKFFSTTSLPILNDAHLLGGALLTHSCPWGIAVIAGTGSVVLQLEVTDDGKVIQTGRRGGVGFLLGDDGSAFDLGKWAIRLAVDEYDRGLEKPGGLAEKIRNHFGVKRTPEVLAKVYVLNQSLPVLEATNLRKLRIATLAKPIIESYNETPPDPMAVKAVNAAAGLLVDSIVDLVKYKRVGRRSEDAALIMGGGVVRQTAYREVLIRMLKERGVVFGVEECVVDVAGEGCLGLVARACGDGRERG